MWVYTTILHSVKKQFGLTELDYCIIDTIARLSAGGTATHKGWCNASNKTISDALYTSPKNIISVTKKAIQKGLLEVMDMGIGNVPLKRATEKWHNAVNLAQGVTPKVTGGNTKGNTLTPKVIPPSTKSNEGVTPLVTPPNTFGNYIDNNTDKDTDSNTDIADFKKSVCFSASDISKTVCPENLNADVFAKLKDFATDRQGRTKKERLTEKGWLLMVGKCSEACKVYSPAVLISHIENAIISNSWKSPFFTGYEKLLIEAPKETNETAFEDAEIETKYLKTQKWILARFEFLPTTKIRPLNRAEWKDLFFNDSPTMKEFTSFISEKNKLGHFSEFLTKLSTETVKHKTPATLYNYLLSDLKRIKAEMQKTRK